MAKNWKVGEALRAIQSGNKEDILDIGRRFPLFANLAAQCNEAGATLLDCVPEYCSARKIESVLKDGVQESTEDEAEEEAPAKEAPKKAEKKAPAPKKAAKKVEEEEDDEDSDSLESKSAKDLFEMCKEAGLKVKPKQDKSVYIEALKAAEEDAEDEEDDWDESEDEEEEAPKKPAKKAEKAKPAKKAAKKAEDDDEDWEV